MLILPEGENKKYDLSSAPAGNEFYNQYDVSARQVDGKWVANTLADLTRPENRFAHIPKNGGRTTRRLGSLAPTTAFF